eukprot:365130-Chlamydomonas_euryale.AAC.26
MLQGPMRGARRRVPRRSGLFAHQVAIEDLVSDGADGFHDHRANCDVGHKAAVHDIDVNPVAASLVDGLDLRAEARPTRAGRHASKSAAEFCDTAGRELWPRSAAGTCAGRPSSAGQCASPGARGCAAYPLMPVLPVTRPSQRPRPSPDLPLPHPRQLMPPPPPRPQRPLRTATLTPG